MNRAWQLLATVFPGAYRFITVNVIAIFAAEEVSAFFAKSFFEISLLATFSGVAVSSQAYVKGGGVGFLHGLLMVLVLMFFSGLVYYCFWVGEALSYLSVVASALFLSTFEVARSKLAAEGGFFKLVMAGGVAFVFLGGLVYVFKDSSLLLLMTVFLSLALSVVFCGRGLFDPGEKLDFNVVKDVFSYSLSGGLSTGLSFIVPVVLIGEYGEGSAVSIAQVFTLSALFFFYPRYLSAGFLVEYRKGSDDELILSQFNRKVFLYFAFVSIVFGVSVYVLDASVMQFYLLFLAMQLGQLSLPYANVHMVLGKGQELLEVNLWSLIFLLVVFCGVYFFIDKDGGRGGAIMFSYLSYMLVRYFLTKRSFKVKVK